MLLRHQPISNTERQRRFRERHPGYYQRLHEKRKAEAIAYAEAQIAEKAMAATRQPLMLPAPAETIEIPGMTTIPAISENRDRAPLPVSQEASIPSPDAKSLAAVMPHPPLLRVRLRATR